MPGEIMISVSLLIALVGCFVGLAGWLSGRDKKLIGDAQWRGSVNAKLDMMLNQGKAIDKLDGKLDGMMERLTKVEASAAQAHKRIDEIGGKRA